MRSALWSLLAAGWVVAMPAPVRADEGPVGERSLEERVRALEERPDAPTQDRGRFLTIGDRLLRRDADGEGGSPVSIGGWVNSGWSDMDQGWSQTNFLPGPANVLMPNTDNTSFVANMAWMLDAEVSENVSAHFEQEFQSNGTAQYINEVNIGWQLCEPARLVAGRFWSPFGILNKHWNGWENSFSMLPNASGVLPPHYVDTGAKFEGSLDLGGMGLNYVAAATNGSSGFVDETTTAFAARDQNQNKTFTARGGLVLMDQEDAYFEAGASWLNGDMSDAAIGAGALAFPSDLRAFGVDAMATLGPADLRGYWATSTQNFGNAGATKPTVEDLDRTGLVAEAELTLVPEAPILGEVRGKFRYDDAELATFQTNSPTRRKTVLGYGVSCYPEENFRIGAEYYTQHESGTDNTFSAQQNKDDGYTVNAAVTF
ncbi:MAG: hypothetical protein HY722_02850 [Planctomycetes bacterium]|nr:hypothetical protein [Planctomycetota bacterium]